MSARELWQASRQAGETLARSPDAAALREVLDIDGDASQRSPSVTMLQHLFAGFGALRTRPLLVGLYLPRIPSIGPMPGYDQLARIDGGSQLLESTARLASAALSITAHLRSRLPDYPDIPVPDLSVGSPTVVEDGFMAPDRFPWPAARPPYVDAHGALRVGEDLQVDLEALAESVGQMLEALEAHEAWQAFVELSAALDAEDRAVLGGIVEGFTERTAPQVVDAVAGGVLMQRAQYARAVLDEVHEQANGRAGQYLAAFRLVDHLITMALAVVSERATYRFPVGLPADSKLTWHRAGGALQVHAVVPSDPLPFLYPGRIVVYQGEPPAGGAMFLRAASHTINFELGSNAEMDCEGLENSAGVFDDLISGRDTPEAESGE